MPLYAFTITVNFEQSTRKALTLKILAISQDIALQKAKNLANGISYEITTIEELLQNGNGAENMRGMRLD